jgi:hypothetical protein
MAEFAQLANLAEGLAAEPSRLKKRAAIAEAIRAAHAAEERSGQIGLRPDPGTHSQPRRQGAHCVARGVPKFPPMRPATPYTGATMTPRAISAAAALVLCAALLGPGRAAAQSRDLPLVASDAHAPDSLAPRPDASAPSELQLNLDRLGASAASLEHSLPSITCTESGVSQILRKRKTLKSVAFAATLRAVRTPGAGLHESFTLIQVKGKPTPKPGEPFPFFSKGGFDSVLAYFLPAQQPCYIYSLSARRIDFATAPDAASRPPCRDEGVRGFALLDAEGNVTHIERTVPIRSALNFHLTPYASVDLAPVELNGRTFRLSRHVVSEVYDDDLTGRFDATYSDCRLFTATATILPPTQVVAEPTPGLDPGSAAGN